VNLPNVVSCKLGYDCPTRHPLESPFPHFLSTGLPCQVIFAPDQARPPLVYLPMMPVGRPPKMFSRQPLKSRRKLWMDSLFLVQEVPLEFSWRLFRGLRSVASSAIILYLIYIASLAENDAQFGRLKWTCTSIADAFRCRPRAVSG